MLEYYQGILILTTNRIGAIDEAFKSRIHLAIWYPPLSQPSRRSLWQTFLRRVSLEAAAEMDANGTLDELSTEKLNGRQIKNLVRTASALAISDEQAHGMIRPRHIYSALRPMKAFEDDIAEQNGDQDQDGDSEDRQRPVKRRRIVDRH